MNNTKKSVYRFLLSSIQSCQMEQPTDVVSDLLKPHPSMSSEYCDENILNVQQWEADIHETLFYKMELENLDSRGCELSLSGEQSVTLPPFNDASRRDDDPIELKIKFERKQPRLSITRPNNKSKTKRLKMYELNIPEAKNAKAAFLNREKKKQELNQLYEQNKSLILREKKATSDLTKLMDKCHTLEKLLMESTENQVSWNNDGHHVNPKEYFENMTNSLNCQ